MAISVYKLKPAFIRLLRPVAASAAKAGITANHVTVAACAISVLYALLLLRWPGSALLWGLLPLWLFTRMALNAIDGVLAREFGQKSRLGALLNEMGDVVADAALCAPLALVPGVDVRAVALFVWMALLTEFAGVVGLLAGSPRRYDGPLGKSDRAFLLGVAGLAVCASYVWGLPLSSPVNGVNGVNWGLCISSALMLWTVINRLRGALSGGAA